MPCQASIETVQLSLFEVVPEPLTIRDPLTLSHYPLNRLRVQTNKLTDDWQVVVLENEAIRVEVLPDLGGMIYRILDKKSGREVLPKEIEISAGERRGAYTNHGIQWVVGESPRPLSLGSVRFQPRPPIQDTDDASVVLYERLPYEPVSWHASVSIPHEGAEIRLAFKLFNRGFTMHEVRSGLSFPQEISFQDRIAALGKNLYLAVDAHHFAFVEEERGYDMRPDAWELLPRETVSWECRLIIAHDLEHLEIRTEDPFAVESNFRQSSFALWQVALMELSGLNDDVEFDDEDEDDLTESDEEDVNPLRLLSADDDEFFDFDDIDDDDDAIDSDDEAGESAEAVFACTVVPLEFGIFLESGLAAGECIPGMRGVALAARAICAAREGNFDAAANYAQDSLIFAGDDPLMWWFLAALHRKQGIDSDVIENAHYIAPLEPMLRAEAFLSQSAMMGREPNPLIAPFANDPDSMLEVACQLMQVGFLDDLARWVDECLRHREVPLLRYLLAYAYQVQDTMMVEAASEISRAAKSPLAPPFPMRHWEQKSILAMHEAFPNDKRLSDLVALIGAVVNARTS